MNVSGSPSSSFDGANPRLAFVYNARDCLWAGMAPLLYATNGALRDSLEASETHIRRRLGWSLRDELMGRLDDPAFEAAQHILEPALTAIQIALTEAWRERGVQPDATGGCCCGEFAAGYARGVLSHADAIELACRISRVFHEGRGAGRIVAVWWPVDRVEPLLELAPVPFYVAGDGWTDVTTIGCAEESLDALLDFFTSQGASCRVVSIGMGAHTPLMDGMASEFQEPLESHEPSRSPLIPGYSFSGASSPHVCPDSAYWWNAVRGRLQVRRNIGMMVADGYTAFLEVGGQLAFAAAINEAAVELGRHVVTLSSMRSGEPLQSVMDDSHATLESLGLVRSAHVGRSNTSHGRCS